MLYTVFKIGDVFNNGEMLYNATEPSQSHEYGEMCSLL